MQREWQPEELIECWTLLDDDRRLVANKTGATRLRFALLLKFFELDGRFPRSAAELPAAAVEYVAAQVKVPAGALDAYQWSAARSSITARRSVPSSGSAKRPSRTSGCSRTGSRATSARLSLARSACERRCCAAVAASASSRRHPSRAQRILGAARASCEHEFTSRTHARLSERVGGQGGRLRRGDRRTL